MLAAAGASVTVLDNSPSQLALDRAVALRGGPELTLVEGDPPDRRAFVFESLTGAIGLARPGCRACDTGRGKKWK